MTSDLQKGVETALLDLVDADRELGVQVAVYRDGELIVDAWAGFTGPGRQEPVHGDTLFTIFSCSKGLMYTVIHALVERGSVDYDTPIVELWPEFGAHGKDKATVRHALIHATGVPTMSHDFHLDDWDGTCRRIAEMAPEWTPGTDTGYHGLTSGYIVGEVARRVHGKSFGETVTDLICIPLGITDLFFGVPDQVVPQIAELQNGESMLTGPFASADTRIMADLFNSPEVRAAAVPAGGAITTARSLAKHYASLIGEGVDGVRLLPDSRMAIATELQTDAFDRTLQRPVRKGLGYLLGEQGSPMGGHPGAFGHSGHGGSWGFADPEHGLAFALTKNRLTASPLGTGTSAELAELVRDGLNIPHN